MLGTLMYLPAIFEYRDHQHFEWQDILELPRNFHFLSMVVAKDLGLEHSRACPRCREFGEFIYRRYGVLALRFHPDRGGTVADMQRLNVAVQKALRYIEMPYFKEIDWIKEFA